MVTITGNPFPTSTTWRRYEIRDGMEQQYKILQSYTWSQIIQLCYKSMLHIAVEIELQK